MLRGVLENCSMKNIKSPIKREITREECFHPVLLGGIGTYQTKAQIERNIRRFTLLSSYIINKYIYIRELCKTLDLKLESIN